MGLLDPPPLTRNQGDSSYTGLPALASTATVYVHDSGDDTAHGRDWTHAKKTIQSAITALGSAGGIVEVGSTTLNVSSTGRFDSCTFTASSSTIADTSITPGDVGSYVISSYLRSPALIASVVNGTSFTITDQSGAAFSPEGSGTALSIITAPAIVVPPGVTLRGRGSEWTSSISAQTGVLNNANTWIVDAGTGITILCGHPQDGGAANSGQRVSGTRLESLAIKGNTNNMFGLAQINNWYVVCKHVDSVGHGLGGLLVAANANATRFTDCRFAGNATAAATKVTAGVVVLDNTPLIPFGPVKFDNCFFTNNYGWNIVGTADFVTSKGARSVRVSQGQFNVAHTSTLTGSGTHVAISGNEYRSLLDDCIFESADVLDLDVYDNPVVALACKFKGTGGSLGTLAYTVRVNSGTFDAIGCGFLDATSYHVQVASGATFNWSSCSSTGGSSTLAADSSGNALAPQGSAGLPAGSTANPVEPLNGLAGGARANETCPRLLVTSSAGAVANQVLNLTCFTATKSVSVSQVAQEVGGTASGGTAVYIGVGLFKVNSDGSLTQIAVTSGSNQNAFQSANASLTLNFSSSAYVTAGSRYAMGHLVNSSNTLPTFRSVGTVSLSMSGSPAETFIVSGQTTMPSGVASGSLASGGTFIYSRLL